MREQPGTQREIKNSILPAFLQGFCILGERVKGWKSERIQGWKGPGGQGPGIMGNLKKGGIHLGSEVKARKVVARSQTACV